MNRLHAASTFVFALVACSWLGAADVSSSGDWPQFRGPKRDGLSTETGLLKEWPTSGPTLAWKVKGLGSGFSSVVISGGRFYTMGDRASGCYLIAFDANKGAELWAAKVGKAGAPGGFAGPRCTPTLEGGLVYALGQHGDLVCVDAASGKERWRKEFKKDFAGDKGDGWGYSESPLIDGESLICTPGGSQATMVALNKKTGALVWKCAVPGGMGAGHASPVIAEVGGTRHYVNLTAGGVIGVAAKTGKLLWKYDKLGNNTANIPTCIVKGNQVFASAGYGKGGALLELTARAGGVDAREVYFSYELTNKHGGWVLVGDHLYGDRDDSGRPMCAELKTGKVVWGRGEKGGPGRSSASVVFADDRLYFRFANGYMALVEAKPDGYKEVGNFKIPRAGNDPSWPHPVVAGGKLYLREQDEVLCYDVKGQ